MKQRAIDSSSIAIYIVLISLKASAADYTAGFTVNTEASHNDNIRLVQNDKTAVNKYDVTPKLILEASTETDKFELDSHLDFNRYNRSEFDSNDQNVALALSHQFENSSLGLNANYIHNSTLTSEQLTSGRIGNKADRAEQYSVSLNWVYNLNEKNLIQLGGSYTEQNYENVGYIGYKNTGAELDWVHLINERIKWIMAGTYSDYRSDDITLNIPPAEISALSANGSIYIVPAHVFGQQKYSTRAKNTGMQLGIDYQWTEQSLLQARLGRSKNDTTYPVSDINNVCMNSAYRSYPEDIKALTGAICTPISQSSWLSTAEINWTWKGERHQFNLSSTKSTQPTSSGYSVDAIQIGSSWSYQLSELDQLSAILTLVRNRAIDKRSTVQNSTFADRNYNSATIQYQRQLTEQWFLNTSFEFSEQKYTQIDYQASSRVISLGILYQPTQWHWSR